MRLVKSKENSARNCEKNFDIKEISGKLLKTVTRGSTFSGGEEGNFLLKDGNWKSRGKFLISE